MVRQTQLRQRLVNFDCQNGFSALIAAINDPAHDDKSAVGQNDGLSEPLTELAVPLLPDPQYELYPESGGVGYSGWWGTDRTYRMGRHHIRIELKKLSL